MTVVLLILWIDVALGTYAFLQWWLDRRVERRRAEHTAAFIAKLEADKLERVRKQLRPRPWQHGVRR